MAEADPNLKDRLLNELSSSLTPATEGIASELPAPAPPVIPDHTLFRCIGRGSYGEVWLARNALGTWRAVKIVHRRAFDSERPYEREFTGIRRFEPVSRTHPSQLNVLHVGRDDAAGLFYYVMELADTAEPQLKDEDGGWKIEDGIGATDTPRHSLSSILNPLSYQPRTLRSDLHHRGRLPCDECLRLGLALATALDHLHRHGLVHRDIKPSNIVFVNGIPKLADIGLVTHVEATISFVGTEGYVPPEGPGTAQADIYSLGKVLYEMATGRDRQDYPELPTNLIEVPAADRAALSELNEVIVKACHNDARQRYQTSAELHADLALLQSGVSVRRQRLLARRLRFVQRAGAVVTALAALIAAGWFWQTRQTHKVRELATEKTTLADKLARLDAENRNRIVRLDIANGVRLLDEGDPAGALLWFADALPLLTNNPAEESIHRIRIQQAIQQTPSPLLDVVCSGPIARSAWSPDGSRFAREVTRKDLTISWEVSLHDAHDGHVLWTAKLGPRPWHARGGLRFSRDSKHLFYENFAAVLNATTGSEFIPNFASNAVFAAFSPRDPAADAFPSFASNAVLAAFSPDERWLVLAQPNHAIRVAHALEEREFIELTGHTNTITMLAFTADGSLLASASMDRSVRLWRLPSGESAGPPLLHDLPLLRVALSDDGHRLATTTVPGTEGVCVIQVWDTRSCQKIGVPITIPMGELHEHAGVFFSPLSGDRLFTAGRGSEVRIWDAEPQTVRGTLKVGSAVRCWDFSPDGTKLAVGCDDGTTSIWSPETGALLYPRFRHNSEVLSVHFSPDGTQLLTTGNDWTAKVWSLRQATNLATLTLSANFPKAEPGTYSPGMTPGPMSIYLADRALHLIDPEQLTEIQHLGADQPGSWVYGWSDGATGHFWATADSDSPSILWLWQKTASSFRRRGLPHPRALVYAGFSRDDSRLITVCQDRAVRIWRTSDGELERTTPVPTNLTLPPLARGVEWFRPDGMAMLVVHGETKRNLQLFDLTQGMLIGQPFTEFLGGASNLRFSPDGNRMVISMHSRAGLIIDFQAPTKVVSIFHSGYIRSLEWSPDGKRLLTAGLSDNARLWDATTGELLLSPMVSGKSGLDTYTARWSADSRFIVTRSDDNFARVWDAATAEAVTPYLPHSGYIRFACITPGNRLITGSDPNLLRAWDLKPTLLPPDVISDYAKLVSGRRLNAAGVLLNLSRAEVTELRGSLRTRAPQLFQ